MKRRTFLRAANSALIAAPLAVSCSTPLASSTSQKSRTFVLVHGAWHGGWCWKFVRKQLRKNGHSVFTPTLTGLGEKKHLLDSTIGLETHIQDILNVIEYEGLQDIILVGHSYAGMIITGVADRIKGQISHIVYLDAGTPTASGQSFISYNPDATSERISQTKKSLLALAPDGVGMLPPPIAAFGISDDDVVNAKWLSKFLTPHPLKTWLDPLKLENGGSNGLPRTFVHCTAPKLANSDIPHAAASIKGDPSWEYREIATGHDAMVSAPELVSSLLMSLPQV